MNLSSMRIFRHFLGFKHEQWLDGDKAQAIQKRRLRAIAQSAMNTKHYHKVFEQAGLKPSDIPGNLDALPICERKDIQDRPADFIGRSLDLSSLARRSTSGSSGIPLAVYRDEGARIQRMAQIALADIEAGWGASDLFANISFGQELGFPLLRKLGLFRKAQLQMSRGEEQNYRELRSIRPDILGWYPSNLILIAALNDQSPDPLRLKRVFCGAEMLPGPWRERLEASFSCPVFNFYGAVETGLIARECPEEHSLHICQTCHVEVVDGNGRPKRRGTGEILVTDLANSAMPLLRYRIGDRGSLGDSCPCGRNMPVIESLEGRSDDMLILPSGRIASPRHIFAPEVVKLFAAQNIASYQVVQEREDLLVFRYVSSKPLGRAESDRICLEMRRGCCGEGVKVEFERLERLERGSTGKLRKFRSKVRHP